MFLRNRLKLEFLPAAFSLVCKSRKLSGVSFIVQQILIQTIGCQPAHQKISRCTYKFIGDFLKFRTPLFHRSIFRHILKLDHTVIFMVIGIILKIIHNHICIQRHSFSLLYSLFTNIYYLINIAYCTQFLHASASVNRLLSTKAADSPLLLFYPH